MPKAKESAKRAMPPVKLTEVEYLRRLCYHLQRLRTCGNMISDQMRRSPAGDCYIYEGGMNAVEMYRDQERKICSFLFEHDR